MEAWLHSLLAALALPKFGLSTVFIVSLVSALAVCDTLAELLPAGNMIGLKWPNDVWIGRRKVAGILVEAGNDFAVVGIGINVALTAGELPTPQSTSLLVEGGCVDREALLVSILRHLFARLEQWRAADPGLAGDYRAACVTLGRIVDVSMPGGRVVRGEATSIDDDGHLEIISQGILVSVTAGDVIHATI